MRVAIDDLQVRQTPIMEQVRPAQTPILVPDAIKRHAMIDFRVLPEAAARLPAAACLKSSQQGRLFAWRIPELPSDDACTMPGGALVRAFAPQVEMPAEVIDTLSAHAAKAGAACKGLFSIGRGRDTKCRGHSALRLAELPRPSVRLAASRRQRTRETIRAKRMSAPEGVDGEPRRRRNEWPGKRPAKHAGWENCGQCLPETRERAAIDLRLLLLPCGHAIRPPVRPALHPNVNACFTPGQSGDARQSEAGSAWEIAPLEERNVAEMSYEVDVLFKGVLNGIRIMLAGMNAPRSGSASATLS